MMAPWSDTWPLVLSRFPWAVAINVAFAWIGYRAHSVSRSGALVGALIGVTIFVADGWPAWVMLLVTFFMASGASRLGLARKMQLRIAEERGGRRAAGNALANCGVAALAAVMALITPYTTAARLAFVAALTAAGSDTVASEIGKAWGRKTVLITNFRVARPGTSGAISLEGSAAGLLAAAGLATLGTALGGLAPWAIAVVIMAATAGALVESVLGATLEASGRLNNDALNFINTAVAAAVALTLA